MLSLSTTDITLCDAFLLQFYKDGWDIYGKSPITPNMHLQGYMKVVWMDYGPVYDFWLFRMKDTKGILASSQTTTKQ